MGSIKIGMDKVKVIQLLTLFPEIDGEIRMRKNIVEELNAYYDNSKGVSYDGVPGTGNKITHPTESAAIEVPSYVSGEIRRYEKEIKGLQNIKVEILREVSHLELKKKNVIFGFYFNKLQWKKIAEKIHYSERQCKNIRNDALSELLDRFSKNRILITYCK